jgi:hypothetical protein
MVEGATSAEELSLAVSLLVRTLYGRSGTSTRLWIRNEPEIVVSKRMEVA